MRERDRYGQAPQPLPKPPGQHSLERIAVALEALAAARVALAEPANDSVAEVPLVATPGQRSHALTNASATDPITDWLRSDAAVEALRVALIAIDDDDPMWLATKTDDMAIDDEAADPIATRLRDALLAGREGQK